MNIAHHRALCFFSLLLQAGLENALKDTEACLDDLADTLRQCKLGRMDEEPAGRQVVPFTYSGQ